MINVGEAELQTDSPAPVKGVGCHQAQTSAGCASALSGPDSKSAADLGAAATQNKDGPRLDPYKSSRLAEPSMETTLLIDYTIVLMYCISKSPGLARLSL